MAEGVPTNNQRGRRSGPCGLWEGLDKARHIVPTTLLVRVQCYVRAHATFVYLIYDPCLFVVENNAVRDKIENLCMVAGKYIKIKEIFLGE